MSAWTYCLQDGKAAPKIVPPRLRIPCWKGLGADSEEKHEPASDIDTMAVDSLKALDPKRPIREADITLRTRYVRFVQPDPCSAASDMQHGGANDLTRSPRRRGRAGSSGFRDRASWPFAN